ncbi:hypothetical protein J2808_001172 [Pseudarthrobacter sulfonivorans]|nr:hypothetical protein [Pseudarthrobacter sulfonivorans]
MIGTEGVPGGLHGGDQGAVPYLFFRVDDLDAALARRPVPTPCAVISPGF